MEDRAWLLHHLAEQARHVQALIDDARAHPDDADKLLAVRDEVFMIRETLDTLGVPHALDGNDEWSRATRTRSAD